MAIDIYLVTGFLGSGKTSLLRSILSEGNTDTALIVNEFGEVGIDHLLLQSVAEDTVLLPNGCLCCTSNGELSEAINRLISTSRVVGSLPLKRIVIETTGLSNPEPVIASILQSSKTLDTRLAGVITVVDLIHAESQRINNAEWVGQVAAADIIVLSKADLALNNEKDTVLSHVLALNPGVTVHMNSDKETIRHLFEKHAPRAFRMIKLSTTAGLHQAKIDSMSLTTDQPLDWLRFSTWLMLMTRKHGPKILRMKAIFQDTSTGHTVVVHGVQSQVYPPELISSMNDSCPTSQVVLIVRDLDPERIKASLRAFLGLPQPECQAITEQYDNHSESMWASVVTGF
jgi:G3E family GTPase